MVAPEEIMQKFAKSLTFSEFGPQRNVSVCIKKIQTDSSVMQTAAD